MTAYGLNYTYRAYVKALDIGTLKVPVVVLRLNFGVPLKTNDTFTVNGDVGRAIRDAIGSNYVLGSIQAGNSSYQQNPYPSGLLTGWVPAWNVRPSLRIDSGSSGAWNVFNRIYTGSIAIGQDSFGGSPGAGSYRNVVIFPVDDVSGLPIVCNRQNMLNQSYNVGFTYNVDPYNYKVENGLFLLPKPFNIDENSNTYVVNGIGGSDIPDLSPPISETAPVIKYLTLEFQYPMAGVNLDNTIDNIRSDIGTVTVNSMSWRDESEPYSGQAITGHSYTAVITVKSADNKFAQAIKDYIVTVNTADKTEVYVKSIGVQFISDELNVINIGVNFSPVGQTNPYDGSYEDQSEIESDPLEEPPNPTITAVDTSFFTAYAPSKAQLNSLASYMWNNTDNWLDTFNRMFANPMECILGLSIVPVSVSGTSKNVVFGNVETSISMPAIDSQYVSVNCGSVRLSEQWRTYLDYNPYTKVRIYLPYCGVHEMDTDEIMGKEIAVTYKVDVLNGNVIAYVKDGTQVKWTFSGNCAMQVPITAQQFNNSIHGYAAAAGNQVTNFVKGLGLQPTLNRQEAMQKPGGLLNWAPFTPFASFPSIGSAISAVQGSKSSVVHQGNFSGGVGQLSVQTPFLVIERPRPVMANVYQKFEGFPNFASLPLASCKGFTRVEAIHLEGMTATSEEQAMIENMLKGGVII